MASAHDADPSGHGADETPVELVRWPAESARRARLARAGIARLLLVAVGADLPGHVDLDEDWVREPVELRDVQVRVEHLRHVAAVVHRDDHLHVDAEHILHRGAATTRLSATEARLVEVLLRHPVASREDLLAAWPPGTEVRPGAVDAAMSRLRKRLRALGIHVRPVRGRGYELHVDPLSGTGPPGQFTGA